MRAAGFILAIGSFLCLAAAEDQPVPLFRVAGVVTNASTGTPVRKVAVTLEFVSGANPGPATQTQIADVGGYFEFASVAAGQYRLRADRRGYPKQEYQPGTGGLSVLRDTTDISFRMEPFAALTGTVVDENGDPIQGAEVQLIRSEVQAGLRQLRPANSALTDDRGQYRVAQLVKGRYYIAASARAQAVSESAVYARRYFPGSIDLQSAAPLELEPGGNQRADFRLRPDPAFHVRGEIRGGENLSGLTVTLAPRAAAESFGGTGFPVQFTGNNTFTIANVPTGQYRLTAIAYRNQAVEQATQLVAVGNSDLDGIVLTPTAAAEITGRVTVEDAADANPGTPLLGPERVLERVNVTLLPEDTVTRPVLTVAVDAAGVLHGSRAAPGTYTLWVNVPEPYYFKSPAEPVEVQPNGSVTPLSIMIGVGGGQVSGTVTDGGKAATGCMVLLAHQGANPAQNKFALTDATGKFEIKAIAPGAYSAFAWPDLSQVEYRNPSVLAQAPGISLTVTDGGKQTADLKLIRN